MNQRTRDFLRPLFRNSARPDGEHFSDLIDSYVNKLTDGVAFDADGNMLLSRGVRLGDSAGTAPGGLRFNSNQLQVFTGGNWVNVSAGGGGVFKPAPTEAAAVAVAHNGNVGIGSFPTAAGPTFRLEVPLGPNTAVGERVRFGNVVCANGTGAFGSAAVFSHQNHASSSNFALRQTLAGAVNINAPTGQNVSIMLAGGNARFGVTAAGNVIVGGDGELPGATTEVLQVSGTAFKTSVGGTWASGSDARIKDDVRDLEAGLSELLQVRPVRFRYNGRAGTEAGQAGVGVLGQEIETVLPETIRRVNVASDPGLPDMRVFDPSALTFVLINAVKELAARVEHLEQALAAATTETTQVPVTG